MGGAAPRPRTREQAMVKRDRATPGDPRTEDSLAAAVVKLDRRDVP
jgi:hypothetical protein